MTMEISDLVIPKEQIILHKEYTLGRGGYGYVCYGTREIDNGEWEPVAVKMMITEGCIPESVKKELIKEACKLREVCQHDNIVKLLGILMEPDNYGLILELMVFANSIPFINDYSVIWPQNKLPVQICCQVSSAMTYLHSFDPPMLHMDLKGDNILINHEFDAKICDFGISEWKTRTTRPANSRQGTLSYVAPEILRDVNIRSTKAQDVYSFGICTWEMFTGQQPYRGKNDDLIKTSVKEGQRPDMKDIGERCPDDIVAMMKQCWNQNPDLRPSFEELQKHLGAMCKTIKKEIFLGKKAVRKIICQKHPGVNDIKRLMTTRWDELDEPLNDADISIDAIPMSEETLANISADQQGETYKDEGEKEVEVAPTKESQPSSGKRYKFNLPKKNLTEFDKKVREILRDPLLMEMVVSGNADHLNFPKGVKELFSDPTLLQKYIDEDSTFKFEFQGQGHSVFDSIQTPKIKDAKHKGMACQYLAECSGVFHYSKYAEKRRYQMNERALKQDARLQSMGSSFYKGKLFKSGLYDKVVKALKEPHQILEAFTDLETGSEEVEKFTLIGHDVLEVLQDPVMMQILLSQDQEMLDTFMRNYPELTMKLLAKNKTTYPQGGITKKDLRDPDFDRDRFDRDRLDRDPFDRDPFDRDPFDRDPFDRDRFEMDRFYRFVRDPFDSDSDDEKKEMLARMAFDMGIPPRVLASGGVDKRRMMEMLMKEERRRRKERDFRHQAAVKKDKKQEPGSKIKPTPTSPSEAGGSSKAPSSQAASKNPSPSGAGGSSKATSSQAASKNPSEAGGSKKAPCSQGVKDSASKKPSPGRGSNSSNDSTPVKDLKASSSQGVKDSASKKPSPGSGSNSSNDSTPVKDSKAGKSAKDKAETESGVGPPKATVLIKPSPAAPEPVSNDPTPNTKSSSEPNGNNRPFLSSSASMDAMPTTPPVSAQNGYTSTSSLEAEGAAKGSSSSSIMATAATTGTSPAAPKPSSNEPAQASASDANRSPSKDVKDMSLVEGLTNAPKSASNDPGPESKHTNTALNDQERELQKIEAGLSGDQKFVGGSNPGNLPNLSLDPLLTQASIDEMSLADTADGVILYSEADRTAVDNRMSVMDAVTVLKNLAETRVPNLQLRLLDELPTGGKPELGEYIEYILSHFNYIFIYLTPNFTPDTLKRFQSQMCLMDTIINNSWRVIPILPEKNVPNMPLEMQVLQSLKMWLLKDPDERTRNMFIENFVKTILSGREKVYATKYPSLGVHQPDAATAGRSSKQVPKEPPASSPSKQQSGKSAPHPQRSYKDKTEEDAEPGSDDDSSTDTSEDEEKTGSKEAGTGMHVLTHKHSGGGLTKIRFKPGGNIPNLQVGNKNVMIVGASGNVMKTKKISRKSKENIKLTESEEPITKDNIDDVCSEIAQEWRRLARKMGFSEGECEQFRQDFHINGTYEIMYQAMRGWIQKRPREAIQKNLAKMLQELDRDDLAVKI